MSAAEQADETAQEPGHEKKGPAVLTIELDAVAKGEALPETSIVYRAGEAAVVCAETEQRPTVLGLIASGRMRPASGRVTIDGREDSRALRRRIALVDAPIVSEPAASVRLVGVVAEELVYAGRPAGRSAVARTLAEFGLAEHARTAIGDLDPTARIRLLAELALLRPGVEGIVLAAPDRHGGDPLAWWAIAQELAARGAAVLAIAGEASLAAIRANAPTASGAAHDTSAPHDQEASA